MTITETKLWCCCLSGEMRWVLCPFSSCYRKASFKKSVLSIVKMIMYSQTGIKCVSVAAALQAKQGPGEPSKDCLREFREPVGARLWAKKSQRALGRASESHKEGQLEPVGARLWATKCQWLPVRARGSHREGQLEPEGAREPETKPESYTTNSFFWLCSYMRYMHFGGSNTERRVVSNIQRDSTLFCCEIKYNVGLLVRYFLAQNVIRRTMSQNSDPSVYPALLSTWRWVRYQNHYDGTMCYGT